MYHYTECGLAHVWLESGYTVEGDDLVITALARLDDAICLFLVSQEIEEPLRRFVLKHLAAVGVEAGPWSARWLDGDILMSFDETKNTDA